MTPWLVPIDPNVTVRKTKWVCVCDNCQHERIVTYAQSWNIAKGNNRRTCRPCQIELGILVFKTEHLKKFKHSPVPRESNKSSKLTRALELRNCFNNPSKSEEAKKKISDKHKLMTGEKAPRWDGGKNTPGRILARRMRTRLREFVTRREPNLYRDYMGCDLATLKDHIEAQFQEGMSWENYGEWHLDHIFPLSVAFKISEEKFKEACLYTNIQPLWAIDNIKKGNKII